MKRVWLVIAMLLGSSSVFADTLTSTSSSDMSIKYLGQIFGNVPGALNGTGSGLIGGLFGVFDKGVMAVAAIWLMYTITQVLLLTATSDGPQKSIKNWALWLRISLGFGLLIPGPSGYCIAQELMMQVVVQSINLANKTWDYALNYMQQGNAFFVTPDATGGLPEMSDVSDVQTTLKPFLGGSSSSPSTTSMAYELFQDEVCMYTSNTYNQNNKDSDPIAKNGSKVTYHMIPVQPIMNGNSLVTNSGVIYFPGYGDTNINAPTTADSASGQIDVPSHACGSISLPSSIPQTSENYQTAYAALQQAAIDIQPLAEQIANTVYSTSSNNDTSQSTNSVSDAGSQYLFNGVMNYLQLMQPVANYAAKTDTSDQSTFVTQAEQNGWFNAGAFYWELVKWNNAMDTSEGNPASYVPTVSSPTVNLPTVVSNANATALSYLSTGIWGDAQSDFVQWSTGRSTATTTDTSVAGNTMMIIDMGIISTPIHDLITKLNSELQSQDKWNPMLMSYNVGKQSLESAGLMWTILIPIYTVLSAAGGICDAVNPGNVIFKGIVSWLTPMTIASSGFLFATGAMLTFYVPLYPYLLFLFGVVGWLLYVCEAMVAAPLVAFGMTHPEGHDFMGRAEQALMLALGVFLRPTLMIIGYFIGMVLVYVTSGFLNTVLGQVFISSWDASGSSLGTYTANAGNGLDGLWTTMAGSAGAFGDYGHFSGSMITDCLVLPVVLTIYSMIMLEIVNQCFSAIHQVPDMVLRWIGGPQQQSQVGQQMAAIKGAAGQASQQGADTLGKVGSSSQGLGQAAGSTAIDSHKKIQARKKGGDDTPATDPDSTGGGVAGS